MLSKQWQETDRASDSHALLQDVEGRLEESKAEFEASQGALEAAEEALREQAADTARLEGALESKTSEVAEFGERHKELAAEAQVLQAETCRCAFL